MEKDTINDPIDESPKTLIMNKRGEYGTLLAKKMKHKMKSVEGIPLTKTI